MCSVSEQKHTPEPFGYFKAEPFGWTDCAETDDCAIPLYDEEAISAISKQRDSFKDAAEFNKRRAEDAEKQRDELLAALSVARARIDLDRETLFDCHKDFSTNTVTDDLGKSGLAEYDATLHTIDDAIGRAKPTAP